MTHETSDHGNAKEDKTGWALLVRFEDQSPSYCYGFEAGIIWKSMENVEPEIKRTVREENLKTLQRMADARSYELIIEATFVPGWFEARFRFIGSNPVKKRLSIIPGGLNSQ